MGHIARDRGSGTPGQDSGAEYLLGPTTSSEHLVTLSVLGYERDWFNIFIFLLCLFVKVDKERVEKRIQTSISEQYNILSSP